MEPSIGFSIKMQINNRSFHLVDPTVEAGISLEKQAIDPHLSLAKYNLKNGQLTSGLGGDAAKALGPMKDPNANSDFQTNDDAISMFKHQSREEHWKANPVKGSTDRLQRDFRASFSYFDKIEQ
jgi:hypothetical protein